MNDSFELETPHSTTTFSSFVMQNSSILKHLTRLQHERRRDMCNST